MQAKYLLSPIGYQESLYESEFFRNFTQRREVNQYQRFRTPTDPAFKGQKIFLLEFLMFQVVTGRLFRNVGTELPLYETSNPRRGQTLCTAVNEWKI